MLNYNVYKNCTDSQFSALKERLENLKQKIEISYKNNLALLSRADDTDILGFNFKIRKDKKFYGVISLLFNDNSNLSFKLALIKTIDIERKRYYKKVIIEDNIDLDFFEIHLDKELAECLRVSNEISEEELLKSEFEYIVK